jgi:SAM-dependent methyltransferase
MSPNQAVINQWTGAAPYWEKHRDIIRQMFAPVTGALVEDARIASGHTVLDIASGSGEPALSIAAVVAPEGRVFGIDPIPGMVAAASRAAQDLAVANAQFDVAFADQLPFPPDTFDAVVSRFGAMFFPSPADALRDILRVLKPGRRLALAVWHSADANPFFHIISRVIDRFVAPPPLEPDALDAFRFATPGKLRDILRQAGVVDPSERLFRFPIQAPVSVVDYWTLRFEMSERLRERVSGLTADQLSELKRETFEVLREYSTDRGLSFPAEILIVSGTK